MIKQRFFHGEITPSDILQALNAEFNTRNLRVRQFSKGDQIAIQLTTSANPASGGSTSLTVFVEKIPDGVSIKIGDQSQFGVVASLGKTALLFWKNPWNLISRLDDIAQDYQNLQLSDHVWELIEETAKSKNATFKLSKRLRRIICEYCLTPNPISASHCIACGAPLGQSQPVTCQNCGYVVSSDLSTCPNCGAKLS